MKRLFLILLVLPNVFISCEKDETDSVTQNCQDCTYSFEVINGYDISNLDLGAGFLGYDTWADYWSNEVESSGVFCDEALEEILEIDISSDLDDNGTLDCRYFWDCQ